MEIDQIKKPVKDELEIFEKKFKASMKSNTPLLDKITYYIVQKKGKQVRPILVFLAAKTFGEIQENTYIAASLIELLHTATLVHDDVVDDAYERRGFFSINALWKNKVAVLVGDFLLSQGMNIALESGNYQQLHIVSRAIKQMAEGELLQIEKARKMDIEESIYYEIIRQKTATLIAAACMAGVSSVSSDTELMDKAWIFGEKIGIAFQIKDDLFDYGDVNVGKPRGIDIKEKKMTLPLIYALNKTDRNTKNLIINHIKRHSSDEVKVKEVIHFVKNNGGIEYAEQVMKNYRQQALDLLETFPDNDARSSLRELVDYVINRNI